MKRTGMLLLILTFVSSALLAGTIKGLVTEAKTGNPLVGANVYLDGTTFGAATDMDGAYIIEAPDGRYDVVCAYVGYKEEQQSIKLAGELEVNFELKEFQFSQSIVVIADRAKERETPVAFTDVSKKDMEVKLGSQDIPMVLNTTPSVYATVGGGGAGDARINVRGFNQRNIAVMINGVPMNDMENGWVYWSNWDGLGDATNSIQVQRGLSAVNLATPSIGGTMNIITDPSQQEMGFNFKQEIGNDGFIKSTLFGHTGLVDDKWAISAGGVRKIGDGIINSTWTDAWAYYFGAQYNINKNHRLEIYAIGAPQRHGQNLYRQNAAAYDSSFAKSLDGFDPGAIQAFPESKDGQKYNENWNTVSSSYTGKQWDGSEIDRYDSGFINERENFFHKPLVNLNWYAQLAENFNLYTVLYWSGGEGGGTGTYENRSHGPRFRWDYSSQPTRIADWDANIAQNDTSTNGSYGILRNSRNNQYTFGALVKSYWKPLDNTTFSFGLDWRTAEIDHFREVRDLLGGTWFNDVDRDGVAYNDFRAAGTRLDLGDKIAYDYTNTVDWFGVYAQGEYNEGPITAYGTLGYSGIKYTHVNHFMDDGTGSETTVEADYISGLQIKGGAAYRLTGDLMVFGNLGYVSKVPILDAVIDDNSASLNPDPQNEIFYSVEAGADWRGLDGQLSLKGNFYYTIWQDRTNTRTNQNADGDDILTSLTGMDQTHLGFEIEAAYQPMRYFRLDLAGSIASWEHTSDATGTYKDYSTGISIPYSYSLNGLKIGDAPQTQLAFAVTAFPVEGMRASLSYRYYTDFYADFNPLDREYDPVTETGDWTQSWLTPSYGILDFHFNYLLPIDLSGVEFTLFAHVFNILDEKYVQDALDNSPFNGYSDTHKASDAEIYMGLPLTFNMGFTVTY